MPVARAAWARLPVRFEENLGQFDSHARFVAQTPGASLVLADDGARLSLRGSGVAIGFHVDGGRAIAPRASERLITRSHYFAGSSPARWTTNVPNFGRVTYASVLDGVDLTYHGEGGRLEYDFVVAPRADPSAIVMDIDGPEGLTLGDRGHLLLRTMQGTIDQPPPTVFTVGAGGERGPVSAAYRILDRGRVSFEVAAYDRSQTLVIDPVLAESTYLGGAYTYGNAIAVDPAGQTYVGGTTAGVLAGAGTEFDPTAAGGGGFVAKFDPSGRSLVYVAYLGSAQIAGIAVDGAGDAFVTGVATPGPFPVKNALQPASVKSGNPGAADADAFVTELGPGGGELVYSTYLGGLNSDEGKAIAVDAAGNAYVAGHTSSSDFPIPHPLLPYTGPADADADNAFVVEIAAGGVSLVYGTFLGGTWSPATQVFGPGGWAYAYGIGVDASGNAYVAGCADSNGFPFQGSPFSLVTSAQLAFVTEIAHGGGSLVYSTLFGGSAATCANAIAVDPSGDAYVTGYTSSPDFPTRGAAQSAYGGGSDAFVTEIGPAGASVVYSTYLGGSDEDDGRAIAVDSTGHAYVTGDTISTNFPTVGAVQASLTPASSPASSAQDVFVTDVAPGGASFVYSTYLGGGSEEQGQGIGVDDAGTARVTGVTWSPDFPTRGSLFAGPDAAGSEAFVVTLAQGMDDGSSALDAGDAAAPGAGVDAGAPAQSPADGGAFTADASDDSGSSPVDAGAAVDAAVASGPGSGSSSAGGGGCSVVGAGVPSGAEASVFGLLLAWVLGRGRARHRRRSG